MRIPAPLIAALSDVIPDRETHATLDSLFLHADAPGEPPDGSKRNKVIDWLRRANKELEDPLSIVGPLIEAYMEEDDETSSFFPNTRKSLNKALERCNLIYVQGGHVSVGGSAPTATLAEVIRGRNLKAIEDEFHRALENVNSNPREAVSAAANILESTCKTFIEDNSLDMPTRKDLKSVWAVVRKELNFEPSKLVDEDLKRVVGGMASTVDGIASLRTHASSAHGQGRTQYNLEPRHARLAVSAAHSVTMFILESWGKRSGGLA